MYDVTSLFDRYCSSKNHEIGPRTLTINDMHFNPLEFVSLMVSFYNLNAKKAIPHDRVQVIQK